MQAAVPARSPAEWLFDANSASVGTFVYVHDYTVLAERELAGSIMEIKLMAEPATYELTDDQYRKLLKETKCFACVGVSANSLRPSFFVIRYLARAGYRVIPVNPAYVGQTLFGEEFVADLASVPKGAEPDIVDIFRRPEEVLAIVEDALSLFPSLKAVWMQIGIKCPEAAVLAESKGVIAIQDRCPKIERQRLFGELRMAGFNTRVISSRIEH